MVNVVCGGGMVWWYVAYGKIIYKTLLSGPVCVSSRFVSVKFRPFNAMVYLRARVFQANNSHMSIVE